MVLAVNVHFCIVHSRHLAEEQGETSLHDLVQVTFGGRTKNGCMSYTYVEVKQKYYYDKCMSVLFAIRT